MPIDAFRSAAIWFAIAQYLLGCKVYDPLYCAKESDCSDPSRPFCDLQGEYPGSEGVPRTCIPSPFDAGAGGEADAGGGGSDSGSQEVDGAPERRVVQLALGKNRTCAVLDDGALRCWGSNADGVLGYPLDIEAVGDNEHPFEVGDVPTGGPVKEVALGVNFTRPRVTQSPPVEDSVTRRQPCSPGTSRSVGEKMVANRMHISSVAFSPNERSWSPVMLS